MGPSREAERSARALPSWPATTARLLARSRALLRQGVDGGRPEGILRPGPARRAVARAPEGRARPFGGRRPRPRGSPAPARAPRAAKAAEAHVAVASRWRGRGDCRGVGPGVGAQPRRGRSGRRRHQWKHRQRGTRADAAAAVRGHGSEQLPLLAESAGGAALGGGAAGGVQGAWVHAGVLARALSHALHCIVVVHDI